jgi:hypothetical protein
MLFTLTFMMARGFFRVLALICFEIRAPGILPAPRGEIPSIRFRGARLAGNKETSDRVKCPRVLPFALISRLFLRSALHDSIHQFLF